MDFKFPAPSASPTPVAPSVSPQAEAASTPSRFSSFMSFIFEWEGGYDHDPDDPGGETWFGIDKQSHPHDEIWLLAKHRTGADGKRDLAVWAKAKARASEIYLESYWNRNRCSDLPYPVGEVVMNIAVNAGSARAGKWLQHEVGTIEDGQIGPKTVEAVNAHPNPRDLASVLIARTETHYLSLTHLRKFLKGWLNRNAALRTYLSL